MTQFHPYKLNLEADPDGGFVVTSPDVPELITQGESRDEAIESARDALVTALQGYIKQRRAFPIPSKAPGKADTVINLPELVQAKVLLYNAMIEEGISNSELGRRMGKKSETQIRRMIDPRTNVNFPDLAQAIKTLHMRMFIGMEKMA
jgi:antitoxin HicB